MSYVLYKIDDVQLVTSRIKQIKLMMKLLRKYYFGTTQLDYFIYEVGF